MADYKKRLSLFFFIGALTALVLLSASLSNLKLQAGAPFPGGENSGNAIPAITEQTPNNTFSIPVLKGLLALTFLIVMIYLSSRLLKLVDIKKTALLMLGVTLLFIIVNLLLRMTPGTTSHLSLESSEIATQPSFSYPVSPLEKPPEGLIQLVLLVFIFGVALLAIRVVRLWPYKPRIEGQLSQEAELAVEAIQAGADFRNVIIRCYLQMTRALQEERGIKRSSSMTAREFEDSLQRKGFPTAPVHQLTTLFEKVRYGMQAVTEEDEKMALDSLNEFISFGQSKTE